MSKSKEAKTFVISREQYKKIKKMDHTQMDSFMRNFAKNLNDECNEGSAKEFENLSNMYTDSILKALENTRGIGQKLKDSFINELKNIIRGKVDGYDFVIADYEKFGENQEVV